MSQSTLIYIVDGVRTINGRPKRSLKNFTAAQLGAAVIKEMVRRQKLTDKAIAGVVLGNVVSAGAGQNIARQASVLAGLSESIPAVSVNNVCGSGLEAVFLAARTIKAGDADLYLAGGTESASHYPGLIYGKVSASGKITDYEKSLIKDGLTCSLTGKSMGVLVEGLAKKYTITRAAQDRYALRSHQKACRAQTEILFENELVPLKNNSGKLIVRDDNPNPELTLDLLKEFQPSFKKRGTLTAANSSSPMDGASVLAVASSRGIKFCQHKPLAKIVHYVSAAADPKQSFLSGIDTVRHCLKACHLSLSDIDLFEVCESFAAQAILFKNKLKIPLNKMNIYGGDVALGHPLGSAGSRILVTLIHALKMRKAKRGLACIAFGGGGSAAIIVERVK